MSSFAKNTRGSRIDPRLLFGDEREHLPSSAMGEEAVDPRRRRDNDRGYDRGYDRDGPPPSRAEENGWSRVSQPPAPGIRLTQGDPDGESNWRSSGGRFDPPPMRGGPRRGDYDDRDRYDSRRGDGDSRFGRDDRGGYGGGR